MVENCVFDTNDFFFHYKLFHRESSCKLYQTPHKLTLSTQYLGTCFSDPEKCLLGGMSVSFWLKLSSLNDNQDQYILSSGSQSRKSRGISFLFFHGDFVVCLSKKDKQWKLKIPKKQIPLNKWVNIAFVWKVNDNSFMYYLNGERKQSTKGVSASRPDLKFTIMTAGRPNNAVNSEFMMPLCLSYLALWEAALTDKQVKNMYTNGELYCCFGFVLDFIYAKLLSVRSLWSNFQSR